MANKRITRQRFPRGVKPRKREVVIATFVALSLFAGWTMLAYSGGLDSAFNQKNHKEKTVSPASLNSNSPSKELIYSGGRLICTEEGTGCGSGPGTPGTLTATFNASTTAVDLSWPASTGSVDHYEVERRNGVGSYAVVKIVPAASGTVTATDNNAVIADTAYLYRVRAFDSANCPSDGSVDLATTTVFTNDPLLGSVTVIQLTHLTQLRTAVDAVRATAGLGGATWANTLDRVRAVHFTELRDRLNDALPLLELSPISTDPAITQGNTVSAIHLQAVRDKVK